MPRTIAVYPPATRQKILDLVRARRSVASFAREFEPIENTIRNWIAQTDREAGPAQRRLEQRLTQGAKLRRENSERKARLIEQSSGVVCAGDQRDTTDAFWYMKAQRDQFTVATMS